MKKYIFAILACLSISFSSLIVEATAATGEYSYDGMGRVVLEKNMVNNVNTLTQDMFYKGEPGKRVPNTNTIFVIQYDFVLAEDITIPDGCVLKFDRGCIKGSYTLTGTYTFIDAQTTTIFGSDITFGGTWSNNIVHSIWIVNATSENRLREVLKLASVGTKIIVGTGVHVLNLTYENNKGICLPENSELEILGEIHANSNGLGNYAIVSPGEGSHIHGGKISGDKNVSTARSGEHGHGISVWVNCKIENVEICNCWGDGIYCGRACEINNCKIHDCRRQGISVVYGTGTKITYNNIYNIGGTNPQCCIDIEPNDTKHPVYNIYVANNYLHDSAGGLSVINGHGIVEKVVFENNVIENISKQAISLYNALLMETKLFRLRINYMR